MTIETLRNNAEAANHELFRALYALPNFGKKCGHSLKGESHCDGHPIPFPVLGIDQWECKIFCTKCGGIQDLP